MKMASVTSWILLSLFLIVWASPTHGDFVFAEPTNLGPTVNSGSYDEAPSISADGLTLYFNSNMPGGYGNFDLWMTTRSTKGSPWGPPENLGPKINSPAREQGPRISADGLSLYFNSTRPGGYGPALWGDIWVTERATTSDPWGAPVNLGSIINSPLHSFGPSISHDGLSLFFGADRAGGSGNDDLWVTTRASTGAPWQEPLNLGSVVNSPAHEGGPSISADGLALFFSGYAIGPYRPGGYGNADLWITTRPTVSEPWGTPVNLGPTINTSSYDFFPNISADGSTLYFMSDRPDGEGLWDLWQAGIIPIVDLNGDGEVDGFEVSTMAGLWGRDDPLCDIGPMPWGDGIVDVEDLRVLAEYIDEPLDDPTLIAHWTFDETEGDTVHNRVGDNSGMLVGHPVWRPGDGMVGGALELDGVDDYVAIVDPVLNPADGPFSVLVWIKGAEPGLVIVSQEDGPTWLMIDASEGTLATELAPPVRRVPVPPLVSDAVITDGIWHRVAFVWDGVTRSLYVDGTLVAKDEQESLAGSDGALDIGYLPHGGPFPSQILIDEVRIYNRAVRP